jgi:hypothetical protein
VPVPRDGRQEPLVVHRGRPGRPRPTEGRPRGPPAAGAARGTGRAGQDDRRHEEGRRQKGRGRPQPGADPEPRSHHPGRTGSGPGHRRRPAVGPAFHPVDPAGEADRDPAGHQPARLRAGTAATGPDSGGSSAPGRGSGPTGAAHDTRSAGLRRTAAPGPAVGTRTVSTRGDSTRSGRPPGPPAPGAIPLGRRSADTAVGTDARSDQRVGTTDPTPARGTSPVGDGQAHPAPAGSRRTASAPGRWHAPRRLRRASGRAEFGRVPSRRRHP